MSETFHPADAQAFEKDAMQVSWVSVAGNLALAAFKLIAGVAGHSGAMVSDAIHSASDVFSTIIVMVGIKISAKEADESHPYGHERFEAIASLILSLILFATGCSIGISGVKTIINRESNPIAIPGVIALIAAIVSIAAKEGMYWYTRAAAKKYDSPALMASAWHHRSDALSSVGSFIGILGARLGLAILDPVAAIAISFCILYAAYEIFIESTNKLVDRACDVETVEAMKKAVLDEPDVCGIYTLRTRLFGQRTYVDVTILVDDEVSMRVAHDAANRVQQRVQSDFPKVKHCMVHVHPAGAFTSAN